MGRRVKGMVEGGGGSSSYQDSQYRDCHINVGVGDVFNNTVEQQPTDKILSNVSSADSRRKLTSQNQPSTLKTTDRQR